jgi:type VI secretion system secreted protein VgrG
MGTIKDVLQHPSAGLKQHLSLSIGIVNSQLDVLEFRLDQELNETRCADITLSSANQTIDSAALTIENGSVVFHCPGEFRIKAASFTFEGPASLNPPLPVMPKSKLKLTDQYLSSR